MKNLSKLTAVLGGATLALASANVLANANFHAAVTQHFIDANLVGNWASACSELPSGDGSYTLSFRFTDDVLVEVSEVHFSDGACADVSNQRDFSGQASLSGLNVNEYGQYVYDLQLDGGEEGVTPISLSIERGNLIAFNKLTPAYGLILNTNNSSGE